jgi:hypothetical protein
MGKSVVRQNKEKIAMGCFTNDATLEGITKGELKFSNRLHHFTI